MSSPEKQPLPKISVVTCSYNQAEFIDDCIQSVLDQRYPNFEHIVIDGASTDGTIEKLKKYKHLICKSEKDKGQSDALNKGFKIASGDIIAWINSDDWYPGKTLIKVGEYFRDHPETKILIGDCLFYNEGASEKNIIVHNSSFKFDDIIRYWDGWIPPTQPAIFFRRELFEEVGYLDESLHFAMDYDLWLRISQKYDIAYLPKLLAGYRFHNLSKSGDVGDWKQFYPEWNMVYQRYRSYSREFSKVSPIISVIITAQITDINSQSQVNTRLKHLFSDIVNQIVQDLEIIVFTNHPDQLEGIPENESIPVRLIQIDSFDEGSIQRVINKEIKGGIIERLFLDQEGLEPDHYVNLINKNIPNQTTGGAKGVRVSRFDTTSYTDALPVSAYCKEDLVFSVIIPTYNRSKKLEKCLQALAKQTFPVDQFEVIVCDDGSTDDTSNVVGRFKAPYNLTYICQENSGPAKARNRGLKKARGQFVLFINDDTILARSALARHYETHLAHPGEKISVLGTFDFPEEYHKNLLVQLIEENDLLFEYHKMQPGGYHDYNYFYTCNLSVPRLAVLDVGMFDETFDGPAAEDIDLGLRLYKKGYQLIYQPVCKSWHDHPVTLDGFCQTHHVRGYGHMTLVSKYPELNYWKKISAHEFAKWVDHWTSQKTDVDRLLDELKKTGIFKQGDPKGISRRDIVSILILLKDYFGALGKMSHPYFRQLQKFIKNPDPLVSVIIPCSNYGKYLKECVESVIDQTYQNLEVIIVNDGSFDDTAQVAQKLSLRYKKIRVISQKNSGQPAIARNNGITAAKGDYILCLDADDKISPEFIEHTVHCLEQNPDVAIAYPDQQDFGSRMDFEPHPEYSFYNLIRFNFIPPASLFRKEAWDAVDGFATNVVGYEDWDFWVACGEKGFTGKHVAEAIWHYRVHGDGLYNAQKGKDQRLKARVVMNHPGLYTKNQQEWAKGVLTGDPKAMRITGSLGMVPKFEEAANIRLADHSSDGVNTSNLTGKHILFTMYGWDDEGGGTILPRQIAKELVRRGNKVSVIYTPSKNRPDKSPYYVEQSEDGGVQLFAIYNRPAIFYDLEHPDREIDDPRMCQIVRSIVSSLKPDIVHYHSFLNFSMGVAKDVHEMGIPSVYTSHNYWPLCPRMYLFDDKLNLCSGPIADGSKCTSCVKSSGKDNLHAARAEAGRTLLNKYVDRHLAVSSRVKEIFVSNGHYSDRIHVLQQQPEIADKIWEAVGARRQIITQLNRPLRVGFIGSLLPQKGVHLMVKALQAFSKNQVEGYVFGGGPEPVVEWLKSQDKTGRITFAGGYKPEDLTVLLGKIDVIVVPSVWEDCAPLVVAEALAARLPVVGAKIGGIPDFIDEGKTGFLFSYNNVTELVQRISAFVSDRSLLGKMQGQITRNRTFGDYVDDLLQHYEEVMSSSGEARQFKGEDEKPSVVWEGSQFVTHSLAHVNRSIGKQLIKRGFNLSLIPFEKDAYIPDKETDDYELYQKYRAAILNDNKVHVRHHWPPNFTPPASGHWVMIQPWEFGSLPEKWIRPMSTQLDEIWVPSNYVKECYVRSGVPEDRIQVVPNGVDVETFNPSAQPYHLKTKKAFKFLFVGGTIGRKGIDVLLDVYVRNFKATDDVCLVIKDMGGKSFYQGQTAAESIAQLQTHPDAPEIEYIDHELANDEMAGLYTACDCLVHPYRGEGFGLPIAEAMSAGLPVVVTNHGAALDFCNQDNAWLVGAKEVKLKEKTIGTIPTVDYPWWAEPDSNSLAKCMHDVLGNPGEAKRKAERARKTILNSFTWDCVGNKVEERLLEISKRPVRRMKPVSEVHWDSKEAFIQYFMQGVQRQTWNDLEKETHKACQRYSDDAYIWVLRAISLRTVSRFDDAIEAIKMSLKISVSPEALHEAIQIAEVTGEKEKAARLMEELNLRFSEWTKTNISTHKSQR